MEHTAKLRSVILAFVLFVLESCSDSQQQSNAIYIKTSLNQAGATKAILFEDEGNATVDNFLFVSIYNYSYNPTGKEQANTFSVDRNHGAMGLDSASINMTWISADTLQIDYDSKLRTFMQESRVGKVNIIYKPR